MEWLIKDVVGSAELQVQLNDLTKQGYHIISILNSETRRGAMVIVAFMEVKSGI